MRGRWGDGRSPGIGWAGSPAIAAPPDVLVHGAGWLGQLLADRLRAAGVEVGSVPTGLPAEPFLGLVLPCHPEHPHRFVAALGEPAATELIAWARPAREALAGLDPVGVEVPCAGPDAHAAPLAIAAARAIGLRAEPTDAGYRLLEGGRMPQLPAEAPGASATGAAELHVWATPGVPRDPWFADKISAVRWHGVPLALPARPRVSRQFSVFAEGGWMWGARWAEPHLGIGDGPGTPPSAAVLAMLARLSEQDFGAPPSAAPATCHTAGESCDGLPIVGPLPGRVRHIALTGFGIAPSVWGPAAVEAVANGILGCAGSTVPRSLSASRFL